MTALQRGTPIHTQAASQTSAPVHEFRCLYTRDLHKKAKKWHDGSLRFHTFNRRVMVFDDGKNFVGDLHYRQEDEFGEGLELRLDRGVLVDVGERVGETQTDLTPLLDWRNQIEPSGASSPPQQRTNAIPRRVPAASQGKPRSIAEVLGASQGRVGRARLPIQSPYERRQSLQQVESNEPPAKKQRIASGKENAFGHLSQPQQLNPMQHRRQITESSILGAAATVSQVDEVIDISSDEEAGQKAARIASKPKRPMKPFSAGGDKIPFASTNAPNRQESAQVTSAAQAEKITGPRNSTMMKEAVSIPVASLTESNNSNTSTSDRTRLLMPTQSKRRKLMYKALLPSSRTSESNSTGKTSTETPPAAVTQSLHKVGEVETTKVAVPPRSEPEPTLSQLLSSFEHSGPRQNEQRPDASPEFPSASPLFIPSQNVHQSPARSVKSTHSDFVIPSLMDDGLELAQRLNSEGVQPIGDDIASFEGISTQPPDIIYLQNANQPPAEMNEVVMPPPPPPPPPPPAFSVLAPNATDSESTSSLRSRPFRRVLSENDASVEDEVADLAMSNVETAAALSSSFLRTRSDSKKSSYKAPPKVRRTVSDTAVLSNETDKLAVNNLPAAVEESETGPWTSNEAFLLFDWWPPDREKPYYGEPAQSELNTELQQVERPRIVSARDMLRDDVNAL